MRDAIGGIFNISFVAIFLVVISGYLAFSVSYNKAFKVKNKIISTLEQYQGYNDKSIEVIDDYINKIGYNRNSNLKVDYSGPNVTPCTSTCTNGYCIFWVMDDSSEGTGLDKGYFKVYTSVNVSIPVLEKFLPNMKIFQTSGDTMTINANYGCGR